MNDTAFAEAMLDHQSGHFEKAASAYRAILRHDPRHADSLHLLGLITAERGDSDTGIALIRRAMAIDPNRAAHHNSMAAAYRRLGRLQDAVGEYRTAARLRPESAEVHNNLATTLRDLGLNEEALAHYWLAAAHAPEIADIWYNVANALADTDAPVATEKCYLEALALRPGYNAALGNYGRWLVTQNRWADAETRLSEALALAPAQAGLWNNLGIVLQELGQVAAETCYRNAVETDPGLADAHCNLGCLLSSDGRTNEAVACHEASVRADPGFARGRLAACMAQLPILYGSVAEVAARRQHYAQSLENLVAGDATLFAGAIGQSQPFFLPYQGEDDRALQALYGQFACRALAAPPLARMPSLVAGQRVRLGIVSGFFCDHTLFKLFLEGWLANIDRSRFEVTGFHTGRVTDAVTASCASQCDRFVQGLASGGAWRTAVVDAAPHVLLYPEVGIDPVAGRLAAMRLAPVQCVAWGHPVTTGMPTMDHYLSSELMEPPNGDAHYTEHLVRLPNLGLCYQPDTARAPRLDRTALGLHPTAPVFWSGQAVYKYAPQYDEVFPRIAAELGACQFVFIGFAKSQAVTDAFRDRLLRAFAAAGLNGDRHVAILPPMPQQDYIDAVGLADVILDTPGWSGGKSTLDCLAVDPAIVTLAGQFMRGRHTAAILRRIGCEATVAGSLDEYVSIAVRLARDPAWRNEVRQVVRSGKRHAFQDMDYVRALESFLDHAVFEAGRGVNKESGVNQINPLRG